MNASFWEKFTSLVFDKVGRYFSTLGFTYKICIYRGLVSNSCKKCERNYKTALNNEHTIQNKENRLLTEYLSIRFNFVNCWWKIKVYSFNAPTRVKSNFVNSNLWSISVWYVITCSIISKYLCSKVSSSMQRYLFYLTNKYLCIYEDK